MEFGPRGKAKRSNRISFSFAIPMKHFYEQEKFSFCFKKKVYGHQKLDVRKLVSRCENLINDNNVMYSRFSAMAMLSNFVEVCKLHLKYMKA